ncbi:MAG: hypothetical protein P1U74_04680 [Legionellaceae bacterium]|nr:hypothetical protein [Legionellaceae bacterium]
MLTFEYYSSSKSLAERVDIAWKAVCFLQKKLAESIIELENSSKHLSSMVETLQDREENIQVLTDEKDAHLQEDYSIISLEKELSKEEQIFEKIKLLESDSQHALLFLYQVFDIDVDDSGEDPAHEELRRIMDIRDEKKKSNPDFLPGISPESNERLTLTKHGRKDDRLYSPTMLTMEERGIYQVNLKKGIFFKNNQPYTTYGMKSHYKDNYASFTCNNMGEISLFTHLGGEIDKDKRRLVHSSMNAGADVYCAGELKINTKGNLTEITTHSGHYAPTLYNVYKFLQHLEKRGIDITEVKIVTNTLPPSSSIKCDKNYPLRGEVTYRASDLFTYISKDINLSINDMRYWTKIRAKAYNIFFESSNLVSQRQQIADKLYDDLETVLEASKKEPTPLKLAATIKIIDKLISAAETENDNISKQNAKLSGSGHLAISIKKLRAEVTKLKNKSENGSINPSPDSNMSRLKNFR